MRVRIDTLVALRRIAAIGTVGLLILLAAPTAAAESAPAALGPGDGWCHVTADNPHESHGTPDDIVGKGRITCTTNLEKLTVVTQLESLVDGHWTVKAGPNPKEYAPVVAGTKYTGQSTARCESGTYRTGAQGWGVLGGREAGSTAWEYSQVVTDPCG
jgi:hypothetical protein